MNIRETLNHPVLFLFAVTFGVLAIRALLKWSFSPAALNWPGPLALVS